MAERAGISKGSDMAWSKSKDSVSLKLRPVFEIGNSARHYIRAAEKHQQKTTAKRETCTSVVELTTHFSVFRLVIEEALRSSNVPEP